MTTPAEVPGPDQGAPANQPGPKKSKKTLHPDTIKVEHSAHGRTRARVRKEDRTPEKLAAIKAELEQHPDVQNVQIDHRTGSVMFEHDKERKGHDVMIEAFSDVEMLAGLLFEVPIGEEEEESGGGGGFEYARLDQKLADLASRIDEWQAQKTHIHGRGFVLAGGVAALGVAQIAIYGISLEMLPGPMLLYIAYDIHKKVRDDELKAEAKKAALKAGQAPASSDKPEPHPKAALQPAGA